MTSEVLECPICLERPNPHDVNGNKFYCYCDGQGHNRRIGAEYIQTHTERTREGAILHWNRIVEEFEGVEVVLPKEIKSKLLIKEVFEKVLACTLCDVVPTPYEASHVTGSTNGIDRTEMAWNCHCAEEMNHPQNSSAGQYRIAGPEELWGAKNRKSQEKAIRDWNEIVMKWKFFNEDK
jgi:hypothetical protein